MPTLDDLNESLRYYKECVISTKEEIAQQQKDEEHLKQAKGVFSVYSSFISAGFTYEQAWEILITLIKNNKQ